ncbi:hypothetical protein bcere0025_56600 [Bacillus cereus F65185]|nr:hypothetical protein bcere0025_56600 [Bacillus cereus F65185]
MAMGAPYQKKIIVRLDIFFNHFLFVKELVIFLQFFIMKF